MGLKRTPLFHVHQKLGGKLVPFGGWEMPVQYTSILEEHNAVRTAVGLFDVSHMGEVYATGPRAFGFIQNLITNDLAKINDGQIIYSPMCYPHGGIVDDLLVYRFNAEKFLIVVNASNIEKDFQWMQEHANGATLENHSVDIAEVALQGPFAEKVLQKLASVDLSRLVPFHFTELELLGVRCIVSRTGYTGEDGFEIYFHAIEAGKIWDALMEAGQAFGIKPCGLGARDSLRLEAGLMLYGNDMDENVTPLEAPLKWTVSLGKTDFIGKQALLDKPPTRKLTGFEMLERAIPRHGNDVFVDGVKFGKVTSGIFSPTLQKPIGLGFVPVELSPGHEIQIQIRDRLVPARTCSHRFYRRQQR